MMQYAGQDGGVSSTTICLYDNVDLGAPRHFRCFKPWSSRQEFNLLLSC
jgi:hypothetical protein